jgi:hypothetical protein
LWELEEEKAVEQEGIRQPGGGRKSPFETITFLEEGFLGVLERHTEGSWMDKTLSWTHLKPNEIARLLGHEGIEVSVTVLDQLLKKHNFPKPKAVKTLATGETQHRNRQFEAIDQLQQSDQGSGNAVMSMDTKKKN